MKMTLNRERLILLAISALFLLANFGTATRYPAVWVDEIQFADPAVNLALHGRFTSTAWFVQTSEEFWAGNAPLYSTLLAGWLSVFGISALVERSFNFFLMLALVWLVWELVKRNGWVVSPGWRLALAALLMTAQSLSFSYRMGRYDVAGMILFAAAALAWSRLNGVAGLLLLGFTAMLMPIAGLQLIPAATLYCALLFCFLGKKSVPRIFAVLCGLAFGGVVLYIIYSSHGVWNAFRLSTAAVGTIGQGTAAKLQRLPAIYLRDKSSLFLTIAALLVAAKTTPLITVWRRNLLLFAIAAGILIPAALQIVAKFPLYYFWMVFIPLAIALASHLSNVNLSPAFRKMVYSLLVAGALFGLPLRLAAIALNWHSFSQQPIDAFVAKNLSPADAVVSDFKAYYPVKLNCKEMLPRRMSASCNRRNAPE